MRKELLITKKSSNIKVKGFSLVEVLLAVALLSLIILGVASALTYALQSNKVISYKNNAIFLMDEGLEAVRAIRNEAYANLTDGTYGVTVSANKWALSGTSDVVGDYTRQITISTIDSTTKQVVSTVTWPQEFGAGNSVSSTMYLTNWLRSVVLEPSWATPALAATYNAASTQDGLRVRIVGNYAYVIRAGGTPNFMVFDITNTASPTLVGSLTLTNTNTNIFVSGNYAYVTSQENSAEIKVVNIINPASPTLANTINMSGNDNATSVFVQGSTLYVGRANGGVDGFVSYSLANPALPAQLHSLNLSIVTFSIYVNGNYAYVGTSASATEVNVINVTNPSAMSVATTINLPGNRNATALTGIGNTLFVGDNAGTIYSYDITTPTTPTLLNTIASGGTIVNNMAIGGTTNNLLFAATNNATGEFRVIDITNPSSLSTYGFFDTAATLNGVAYDPVRDSVVAVSTDDNGEVIILIPN